MSCAGRSRVLVTGASGFVGTPCAELLVEKGWEVHGVSSRERREPRASLRWWRADLLEPGEARRLLREVRPSHLLHLAWSAGGRSWATDPDNVRWVRASLELLEEFDRQGGERAVFAGTCAEYDWSGEGVCSESGTPLVPATTYGLCKRALCELFTDFVEREGSAVSGAWARLFFLFGPHEAARRLVPSVVGSLLRGEEAHCSHGRQRRDYLFVQDAAEALVALLESDLRGSINIASGEAVAVAELVAGIAERLGGRDLVRLGSVPTPEGDPPLLVADVTRLREELGWRPRWRLDAALDHTINWWRMRLGSAEASPAGA